MLTSVLETILASQEVIDDRGNKHKLHSAITPDEGELIRSLITQHCFNHVLEIGCAYGISSLYIGEALKRREHPQHTIIDPLQNSYWQVIGIHNLRSAGYLDFVQLIEMPSEIVLPRFLEENKTF